MTKTQSITAVSAVLLLLAASAWMFLSRSSHEIVIPAVHGAQR
jgi:hypothetical protein